MNYYYVRAIFNFSILIAAVAGVIKIRKIDPSYYPFIICAVVGSVNEILSFILSIKRHNNLPNNNIYVLIEALLIIWQFKNWGAFGSRKYLSRLIMFFLAVLWIWEYRSWARLEDIGPYFRLISAFIIVICSVNIVSRFLIEHNRRLIRNPVFILCCGFIIFFTYKIFVESFWMYGVDTDLDFSRYVFHILTYVNLATNLIFGIAIICIPTKPRFITLY